MPETTWYLVDIGSGPMLAFGSPQAARDAIGVGLSVGKFQIGQVFTIFKASGSDEPFQKLKLEVHLDPYVD